ncbi:hypothetical protein SpCBS45565_g08050 [Spizellomyces sp. 'palustris']|nr:hypothetical protein SpCBS45565_g08050 [Spizellomyces sp. 'palustris']
MSPAISNGQTLSPPIIHLVRHAQGWHNVDDDSTIKDPMLTPLGENQARTLASQFPYHDHITHIICSPMKRTMQTTLLGFKPALDRGVQVAVLPEFQECGDWPADTGTDRSLLEKEFGRPGWDFRGVVDDWNSKSGKWASDHPSLVARAREARRILKSIKAQHIVVVTHGAFLHYLTEDWSDFKSGHGKFRKWIC